MNMKEFTELQIEHRYLSRGQARIEEQINNLFSGGKTFILGVYHHLTPFKIAAWKVSGYERCLLFEVRDNGDLPVVDYGKYSKVDAYLARKQILEALS